MPNRNELIASLEGRICGGEMHKGGYIHVPQKEAEAILELLKGQESAKPYLDFDGHDVWRCGNCGASIFHPTQSDDDAKNYAVFCRHCGRKVKWKTDRQDCPFRHENGNCLRIGGFCLAVNDEICAAIQGAYARGVADAISFVNSAKEIIIAHITNKKKINDSMCSD